eukprot:SAG22_NODE_8974_length_617_cov_1.194981_2_plen_137_part_01
MPANAQRTQGILSFMDSKGRKFKDAWASPSARGPGNTGSSRGGTKRRGGGGASRGSAAAVGPRRGARAAMIHSAQILVEKVQEERQLDFIHVKGHSADGGNDRADQLVSYGKQELAPYSRLRVSGHDQRGVLIIEGE